jgi:hypothetical protein
MLVSMKENPALLPALKLQSLTVLAASALLAAPAMAESAPQALQAEANADRVTITINGTLFTAYEFGEDLKYPQFYPVNGPRSGESVTTRRTDPFPHHSSLFFACDHVNEGNYWQDRLERGQILSKELRLIQNAGSEIVFEHESRWERPDAEAPFADHRRIAISAPSPDLRVIDFDITLTALIDVTIKRNNHSLFSARMAPDLAVTGGGTLINADGDSGEGETFGRPSPWMDARGPRQEETEGLAILSHPENRWSPSPWFTRNYGFFSPTPLNWIEEPFQMAEGEQLRLRYRVLVHSNNPEAAEIDRHFQEWSSRQELTLIATGGDIENITVTEIGTDEVLFRGSLQEGEQQLVPFSQGTRLIYTDAEHLLLEHNDVRYQIQGRGAGRGTFPPGESSAPPER